MALFLADAARRCSRGDPPPRRAGGGGDAGLAAVAVLRAAAGHLLARGAAGPGDRGGRGGLRRDRDAARPAARAGRRAACCWPACWPSSSALAIDLLLIDAPGPDRKFAPIGFALFLLSPAVVIARRLSHALNAEERSRTLEENARLREDVERMSRHDLKTPLNSILGVTRLLRDDAQPGRRSSASWWACCSAPALRMLEMVNLSLGPVPHGDRHLRLPAAGGGPARGGDARAGGPAFATPRPAA